MNKVKLEEIIISAIKRIIHELETLAPDPGFNDEPLPAILAPKLAYAFNLAGTGRYSRYLKDLPKRQGLQRRIDRLRKSLHALQNPAFSSRKQQAFSLAL